VEENMRRVHDPIPAPKMRYQPDWETSFMAIPSSGTVLVSFYVNFCLVTEMW
jgi:hypothetical protein